MEFDAILIPPRRAAMIAQGLWSDRTINDDLDACVASCPDQLALIAVSLESGTTTDFDKAKAFMLKLNGNGLRLYPETDSLAPAFKSGEIDVGVIWLARSPTSSCRGLGSLDSSRTFEVL